MFFPKHIYKNYLNVLIELWPNRMSNQSSSQVVFPQAEINIYI